MRASVIIPVYNAEKTIRRCVESLLLGHVQDLQVILVNDASKDNSAGVCRQLAAEFPQIVYIENMQNHGVSYSRNCGLEAAECDYIFFVDSDDWVSCEYIEQMLDLTQKNPEELPVCGYTFIDHTQKYRTEYILDAGKEHDAILYVDNLFNLERKVLIQTLWNKVFRRSILERAHIRFDESLSMGEDFQFVVDYMEAAGMHMACVLNRPLYYYIRANQNSLMRKWFDMPFDVRLRTYRRLADCMQDRALGNREYDLLVGRLVDNLIYHVVCAKTIPCKQKLNKIACYSSGRAERMQILRVTKGIAKERIFGVLAWLKRFPVRLRGKAIREVIRPRILAEKRKKVKVNDVSIVAQNCIGGVFYHEMGMQFLSPTIDMFISEPDFMRFVGDLEHYLQMELRMQWEEEYPIGYLDDVRIDFMHYDTCEEAKNAWERRKARIRMDRIVVIATDRNGFDDACFEQWKKLPYKKILYTANEAYLGEPGTVFYPEYAQQGYVENLVDRRAFYKDDVIFDVINSLN